MEYLNGRLNGLPKWTTLNYLLWKKKDNQSLVVLIDGPLPLPYCFFIFIFFMLLVSCSRGACDSRYLGGRVKAGFHMIADDRGSQIAESSAIVCDHMETHFCDRLRSCDRDRRRSQTIAEDRTMLYLLRSSAIVCDHLRSFAILRSYGNQSSAICDRNVSHNNFNSARWFNASKP